MNVMLLVHVDHNGIIAEINKEHHTRGVMACSMNDETQLVTLPDNHSFRFNDTTVHYQMVKNFSFKQLPTRYITPEWIELRTNTINRLKYLGELENISRKVTMTASEYYAAPIFHGLLGTELMKSNPTTNTYASSIQEWAAIQDISVDTAFKELTIMHEQATGTFLRNHALYLKYVRILGQTTGEENMKQVCEDAYMEFLRNAWI